MLNKVLFQKILYKIMVQCYNNIVLITYQEQLGCYKKVENRKALTAPFWEPLSLYKGDKKMRYGIGLDCGITSIGYCVMELNNNDEPIRIIKLGSRIFDKAENPKDGSSLALPRREARGARRRIRRHQHRIERIRYMLVKEGVLSQNELDNLFSGKMSDIYELRVKALDESVNNLEFARVLINLAQRRGFKSNRKIDSKEKEAGLLLNAVGENRQRMQENGYRTVGEMFFKDAAYKYYKRNKGEDYQNTVSRSMIEDEIKMIFEAQRNFGNSFANKNIENVYIDIAMVQRPFDLGPGEGPTNCKSPYAGNQIEKMIGNCTFFPKEKRAAKASYSFQLFTLLQSINNITITDEYGDKKLLTSEQRKIVRDLCFNTASVNYSLIRKKLGISKEYRFTHLSYGDKENSEIEKAKFEYLKAYHQIKKVLKESINALTPDELDEIGYVFSVYKTDEKIKDALSKTSIDENICDRLLELPNFSKFGHISTKACRMIIPYLEQGMVYSDACAAAGIEFKAHDAQKKTVLSAKADQLEEITNPVVKRAVSQTIKVINAIIREQGKSPIYLNIELARELSKSKKERDEIEKQQNKNRQANSIIIQELKDNFGQTCPTGLDIVKLKLWHEQNDGVDPYSLKQIEYARLFEPGYVDIDHIIPYSISFDDSYNNKVLTFSKENRQKSNRIPMQYIAESKKSDYKVWVNNNVKNHQKRNNLLKASISKEEEHGFKARNLNDTKYLSKVLYNYINDNLRFEAFSNGGKKHVTSVNGAATAYMRKRWGISKIREDGDLHHAVDATVIACVTQGMINKISTYSNYLECGEHLVDRATGEIIEKFPMPYPSFRKELEIRIETESKQLLTEKLLALPNYTSSDIEKTEPCFVSRMINHKVTGSAHQETIRSGKEDGYTISKVALSALQLDKDGEIKNYYKKESDTLLYNALKQRLIEFEGNGEKAFPVEFEFYKPKANGSAGPIVKKVKIIKKSSSNVPARNKGKGIAANGTMIRIDVFHVENEGYYFVPIYVADTVKDTLPSLACSAGKDGWKKMDDENFVFSLFPNDLIKIKAKKQMKFSVALKDSTLPKEKYTDEAFVYYNCADISTSSIKVESNDNAYFIRGLGIKSLLSIEKYTVDPIGNIQKVGKEKRMCFK